MSFLVLSANGLGATTRIHAASRAHAERAALAQVERIHAPALGAYVVIVLRGHAVAVWRAVRVEGMAPGTLGTYAWERTL